MGHNDNKNKPMSWEELEEFLGIELQKPTKENTTIQQTQLKKEDSDNVQVKDLAEEETIESKKDISSTIEDSVKDLNDFAVEEPLSEVDIKEKPALKEAISEKSEKRDITHEAIRKGMVWAEVLSSPLARKRYRRKKAYARAAFTKRYK